MDRRLGPYQLVERLGTGGMAEVYLAHAERRGGVVQPCVVKLLHQELARDDDFAQMFMEEARLVARLRHNNIAGLYDVQRHEGNLFLVMEYVNGRDLHSILVRATKLDRKLPLPFAIHVAKGLCAGLHFAHTRSSPEGEALGLVHRDVSPPNILVSTQGEVKLIDFGIAKFNSEAREKTRSGVIKGKFGYMAPEHAWNEELDHRSDLFSVGVCLYEMLTGCSLYGQSDDAMTMLRRAREADIEPVTDWRDVPEELAQIVHRALQPDRDDRFETAHHMERSLTLVLRKLAPDYTGLDAGKLIDEYFDTGDPALHQMSPPLAKGDPSQGPPEKAKSRRDVQDTTRPIADVPRDLRPGGPQLRPDDISNSGAHRRPDVGDDPISEDHREATEELDVEEEQDTAEMDEPTAKLTFADDEMTELFGQRRLSGSKPQVSSSSAHVTGRTNRAPNSSQQRRPEESTRIISDDSNHCDDTVNTSHAIDDASTDPIRETALVAEQDRRSVPRASSQSSGEYLPPTVDMPQKIHPNDLSATSALSPQSSTPGIDDAKTQERSSIARTGALPALASPEKEDPPVEKSAKAIITDRRVQIALAAAFVVIAIVYVLSRLV